MTGPLASLRVVEFTGLGPAPLAGQLLADLGAEVIVIDRASGPADPTDINRRGKKSVALNLKTTAGLAAAQTLITSADILIEGFRPGVMERLGLGPDDCPDALIYGRMTGWGQSGPWSQTAGHDINYLAMTGALHAIGPKDRPPVVPLNLVADFGGGTMFLVFGILAAVIERGLSGRGQVVDAAMVDGVPAMMGLIHSFIARGQWQTERQTNWLDGASHFYRCYVCSDGKYIAVGALEPQFFAELVAKAGLGDADPSQQLDPQTWQSNADYFQQVFETRTRDEWARIFEGSDACVAPVLDFAEAVFHPISAEREAYYQDQGVWQASAAPRFGRSKPGRAASPSAPGNDTDDVLRNAGLTQEKIDAMRASGAIP